MGVTELVLGGPGEGSPWEGEAPAEPKSVVSRTRSPGIPARPPFAHTNRVALTLQPNRERNLTGAVRGRYRAGARWSQQ